MKSYYFIITIHSIIIIKDFWGCLRCYQNFKDVYGVIIIKIIIVGRGDRKGYFVPCCNVFIVGGIIDVGVMVNVVFNVDEVSVAINKSELMVIVMIMVSGEGIILKGFEIYGVIVINFIRDSFYFIFFIKLLNFFFF